MAAPWVNYYAARPVELAMGLGALGLMLLLGRTLRARIGDHMHRIWRWVMADVPPPDLQLPQPRGILYRARQHPYYHSAFAVFRRHVLPNVFGVLVLVWLFAGGNRVVFEAFNIAGLPCRESAVTASVGPQGAQRTFPTATFCAATGLTLESGAQYEITVSVAGAPDADIAVTRPAGFGAFSAGLAMPQRVLFAAAFPFKRLWRAGWFAPVARIGDSGVEQIPLTAQVTRFTARNTGELFLFVNEGIAPFAYLPGLGARFGWGAYYANNNGTATIMIKRVAAPFQ